MALNMPNAFVQTTVVQSEADQQIIMKIRGELVNILLEMSPDTYTDFVVYEGKSKVLYVKMMKA